MLDFPDVFQAEKPQVFKISTTILTGRDLDCLGIPKVAKVANLPYLLRMTIVINYCIQGRPIFRVNLHSPSPNSIQVCSADHVPACDCSLFTSFKFNISRRKCGVKFT